VQYFVNDHIQRSWPEELFQALLHRDIAHSKKLAEENRGRHRHEPTIARVLREAARISNIDSNGDEPLEIVRLLLDDGVHPDVRVKMKDEAAIEVAHHPKIHRLLYERGGKLLFPPDEYLLDRRRVGSQDEERQQPSNASLTGGTPCSGEFRGLIVDIFSSMEKAPYGERHLICHPTVEEMVYTRSPCDIMGRLGSPPQDCKHFVRWIHLPMNHVGSAFAVLAP
jgi:hypothetical protein